MSQANIELARRGYEAFTTRDPEGVLGFLAPDIEAHDFPEMPDSAVYHGPEGFLALVANTLQEFDDFRLEAKELMAPDDQHVLVLVRQVARGKESGAEVEAHVICGGFGTGGPWSFGCMALKRRPWQPWGCGTDESQVALDGVGLL